MHCKQCLGEVGSSRIQIETIEEHSTAPYCYAQVTVDAGVFCSPKCVVDYIEERRQRNYEHAGPVGVAAERF